MRRPHGSADGGDTKLWTSDRMRTKPQPATPKGGGTACERPSRGSRSSGYAGVRVPTKRSSPPRIAGWDHWCAAGPPTVRRTRSS